MKRPIGVWVLIVWSLAVPILVIYRLREFLFDALVARAATRFGMVDLAISAALTVVHLAALVYLFKLRSVAVPLFGAAAVCGAFLTVLDVWQNTGLPDGGIPMLMGPLWSLLIYRYVWRLRERRLLT